MQSHTVIGLIHFDNKGQVIYSEKQCITKGCQCGGTHTVGNYGDKFVRHEIVREKEEHVEEFKININERITGIKPRVGVVQDSVGRSRP